jgi:hypothetical protein
MHKIAIETEAGQVSAELARLGIAPHARVHVIVDLIGHEAWPMATPGVRRRWLRLVER